MLNCSGEKVTQSIIDDIPTQYNNMFKVKNCCRIYKVDWNGRYVDNAICTQSVNNDYCEVKMKLLRGTIFRYCFEDRLDWAIQILLSKNGLALKGLISTNNYKNRIAIASSRKD